MAQTSQAPAQGHSVQSIPLDSSQTYASFGFTAGAGESGSAAWDAAGATIFFGGSAGAGIAGACCIGLGATSGLFRSINSACFIRFFASAKRTGTTRFSRSEEHTSE